MLHMLLLCTTLSPMDATTLLPPVSNFLLLHVQSGAISHIGPPLATIQSS